ncbi:MAG: iron-containing alcohol dehydrogenase [Polyangiaceae bacterium]|nr:iron-containing alcohol dehydrogenase [Polyangiaceae bacterium]
MKLDSYTAGTIVYGRGELARVGRLARPLGTRAFLVRGGDHLDRSGALATVEASLGEQSITSCRFRVHGEPDVATVEAAAAAARTAGCDLVAGLGGGSVLDTAKAVAALVPQPGTLLDYLEVIGHGRPLPLDPLPVLAIPTTAGTGTEVTKNAVIADRERCFKASVRSPKLVPKVALVDPALTDDLPPDVTAATGLDALTQLIEPLVSRHAHPLTDGLAQAGLRLAAGALERAVRNGADRDARNDMSLAALMGGICLANAGLGAVHGIAAPLGATFPVPHGVACAALLPHIMRANVATLRAQGAPGDTLERYANIGELLAGRDATTERTIDAGCAWVEALVRRLDIPRLGDFGVTRAAIPDLVARAQQASSMRANPVVLDESALTHALVAAL